MSAMTPREIVHELDQHIISQPEAKRAVHRPQQVAPMNLPLSCKPKSHPKYSYDWPNQVGKQKSPRGKTRLCAVC